MKLYGCERDRVQMNVYNDSDVFFFKFNLKKFQFAILLNKRKMELNKTLF